jgi:predicted  nucleic acid-binding Zn-ribbon protein
VYRDQINQLKVELASRSERVAEQTDHLLALKSKNDELQKWRTVMDFRLNDIKKKVEPQAHDIEQRRAEIIANEQMLRQMKVLSAKDDTDLEKMETDINDLYDQILKADQEMQACQTKINHFKNDVHRVFTEIEPDCWAAEVTKLYSQFVKSEIIEEENQALMDTLDEFDRHKASLAGKIISLRARVDDNSVNSGSSFLKQIGKNEELMVLN